MIQEKLAAMRRYKNVTHKEMADLIGVKSAETYSNKEKGITEFKSSEMFIISNFFDMNLDEIFLNENFEKHEVKS